ncbi:hypothetical protein [Flavihumibacter petaseus]|uniref:Uncharacterized protein n=1 Tax=Flavihumibacter petaseus NBRC 106054 TaxID=1220578 RepID=A0A0E9N051_9BACT|nr:hypothetical protein [Flavihumibacter petaseus]GAO43229.1 hypothetical protein FPE01S_02_03330 [Flavihumibacter petaseus NBRC 106054]
MKKLFYSIALFGLLLVAAKSEAQVQVGVQVNIGAQPMWGPTGYDYAEYYYLPDIDVYYNIPQRQFVYLDGGRWIFGASLPYRMRHYDLYRGYKVVVNAPTPYLRCDYYRGQYGRYRGYTGHQVVLRDAPPRRVYRDYDRRDRRDDRYDHRDRRYDRYDRDGHYDKRDKHDRHDNGRHNGRHH